MKCAAHSCVEGETIRHLQDGEPSQLNSSSRRTHVSLSILIDSAAFFHLSGKRNSLYQPEIEPDGTLGEFRAHCRRTGIFLGGFEGNGKILKECMNEKSFISNRVARRGVSVREGNKNVQDPVSEEPPIHQRLRPALLSPL